jgi:hypothetical protein
MQALEPRSQAERACLTGVQSKSMGTTQLMPVAKAVRLVIPCNRRPEESFESRDSKIGPSRLWARVALGWGPVIEGHGMSFLPIDFDRTEHPVDVIEQIATLNHWSFDRGEQDEISISVAGGWTQYTVAFTWLAEVEALHVACSFDLKIPEARRMELASLVALINEELWIGHFDIWPSDGVVMFRHAILLAGGAELNAQQCQSALASVVRACERYYQAFQFVVWAGKPGPEALAAVRLETQGRA